MFRNDLFIASILHIVPVGMILIFVIIFDSVWKEGLRFKLLNSGIGGNFYKLIKCMYTKPQTCVKTESGLTPPFVTK